MRITSTLLLVLPLLAARPAAPPGDEAIVARLAAASARDGVARVAESTDVLARRIGPRLTGSERYRRAAEWARDRLASDGLENVRVEAVAEIPLGFERGPSSGRIAAPERRALRFGSPAWSRGTPGPVEGPARLAPETEAALAAADVEARSASPTRMTSWVLVRDRAPGDVFVARRDGLFRERGIAGLVRRSPGEEIHVEGAPVSSAEALAPFPEVTLAASDFDAIERRVAAGEPVRLEFDLRHEIVPGPVAVENVIAEIRGVTRPDEIVVVGAHLDSWDGAEGAADNAAGVAAVLEAARLLARHAPRPARTIRFVLFGGEEQGLLGSKGDVARHPETARATSAAFVIDAGTNSVSGIDAPEALAAILEPALAPIGALDPARPFAVRRTTGSPAPASGDCASACSTGARCAPEGAACASPAACDSSAGCSSDHVAYLAAGVPAFLFRQSGPHDYARAHHTDADRASDLDAAAIAHSGLAIAVAARAVAGLDAMLPRAAPSGPAAPSPARSCSSGCE